MSFLLDTNVVSEWNKPHPNPGVRAWLAEADEDEVFLCVVTLAELRHGVDRLAGRRRRNLDQWLRYDLALRFERRIISIEPAVADEWGRIVARREALGRPIGAMDALLAATAEVHSLTLVTRNAADFAATVKSIHDPWS